MAMRHDFKLVLRKLKQPMRDTVHSLQLQANRRLHLKLSSKAIFLVGRNKFTSVRDPVISQIFTASLIYDLVVTVQCMANLRIA